MQGYVRRQTIAGHRLRIHPPTRRQPALPLLGRIFGWRGWGQLIQSLPALAAVGALAFTAQSLNATKYQLTLSAQGQVTERFGKAIDQLGSQISDVRLGGIYALERLARDPALDQPTVVEVLGAFIRDRRNRQLNKVCPLEFLPTDVQSALTVLSRRDVSHDGPSLQIDLHDTCLGNSTLRGGNLSNALLDYVNMPAVEWSGIQLRGASIYSASLYVANLSRADLAGANLSSTLAEGADFSHANLANADLSKMKLARTELGNTNHTRRTFANLSNADLSGANLSGIDLTGADLTGAKLVNADLTGANLTGADLTGADLTGADLDEAQGI
jgi:uncharacterized protein YjbI with pentapeptide repeats